MQQRTVWILSAAASLTACSGGTPAATDSMTASPVVDVAERESGPARPSTPPTKHAQNPDTFVSAIRGMAGQAETVVHTAISTSSTRVGILVTYRAASPERSAECSVGIVEYRQQLPMLVETSRRLLECSLAPSAELAAAAIEIKVDPTTVSISQTGGRKNASFDLERTGEGAWVLRKASFNYVENNPGTGVVDVINEEVSYPQSSGAPRLSDYDYTLIENDLVRQVVE